MKKTQIRVGQILKDTDSQLWFAIILRFTSIGVQYNEIIYMKDTKEYIIFGNPQRTQTVRLDFFLERFEPIDKKLERLIKMNLL